MLLGRADVAARAAKILFQWAPTLGGECYIAQVLRNKYGVDPFQWAPTLGGECYKTRTISTSRGVSTRFNGHPPLGVNATNYASRVSAETRSVRGFNGHPPLGVNATGGNRVLHPPPLVRVSKGTHPWG